MRASEIYNLYLKPAHLPADGSKREATIERVELATLHPRPGQESKSIVLSFVGKAHKLILNQTNANRLVIIAGDDTDAWKGLVINLSRGKYGAKDTVLIEPAANGNSKK
jgi:hypothetical protein